MQETVRVNERAHDGGRTWRADVTRELDGQASPAQPQQESDEDRDVEHAEPRDEARVRPVGTEFRAGRVDKRRRRANGQHLRRHGVVLFTAADAETEEKPELVLVEIFPNRETKVAALACGVSRRRAGVKARVKARVLEKFGGK